MLIAHSLNSKMIAPQLEIYIYNSFRMERNFTQKMSIIKSPKQELIAEHLELESVVEVAVNGCKTSQNVASNNIF